MSSLCRQSVFGCFRKPSVIFQYVRKGSYELKNLWKPPESDRKPSEAENRQKRPLQYMAACRYGVSLLVFKYRVEHLKAYSIPTCTYVLFPIHPRSPQDRSHRKEKRTAVKSVIGLSYPWRR